MDENREATYTREIKFYKVFIEMRKTWNIIGNKSILANSSKDGDAKPRV